MAYFPFFMDIENKRCLIVGGGTVALRKIEKLLPFAPEITVISERILDEIKAIPGLRFEERAYRSGDEEGFFFVIAATDSNDTNTLISTRCRKRNIPVNSVDDRKNCSFIFPSLIKKGPLTVGISTSGSSPTAAITLKEEFSRMIPDDLETILEQMQATRDVIKKDTESERGRRDVLKKMFSAALEKGRALTDEEIERLTGGNDE